jgi:hypothetical protein
MDPFVLVVLGIVASKYTEERDELGDTGRIIWPKCCWLEKSDKFDCMDENPVLGMDNLGGGTFPIMNWHALNNSKEYVNYEETNLL